jgi:sortase (surface protein transpeptidase)
MKKNIKKFSIILGICLFVSAISLLSLWIWNVNTSKKRSENYVETILSLIPPPQSTFPEERADNTMPTFSLSGTDFVGVLEFPQFNSKLPVGNDWGKTFKYPCRFSGSVYDRTIQIGATTQKGQYDFYREMTVGDSVFFTDMEGNRFAYEVTDIRYEKHADQAALLRHDADLTLFIKNMYAFEYIIIFCDAAG